MPNLTDDLENMKSNLTKWKGYEETEEDKKVYERNVKVLSIQVSKGSESPTKPEENKN